MNKKIRKTGSFLSMENLDIQEESEEDIDDNVHTAVYIKNSKKSLNSLKLDSESLVLHPVYILEQAFSKV